MIHVVFNVFYLQAFLTSAWIVETMEVTGNESREEARQRSLATLDYMVSTPRPPGQKTCLKLR